MGQKKWNFDGERGRDHAFVYVFEDGRTKKMLIDNGNRHQDRWQGFDAMYFGDVSGLVFTFNGDVRQERRIAVVKYYFMLGHAAGLYDQDPGFKWTQSFQDHLHVACRDLMDAGMQDGEVEDADEARVAPCPCPYASTTGGYLFERGSVFSSSTLNRWTSISSSANN